MTGSAMTRATMTRAAMNRATMTRATMTGGAGGRVPSGSAAWDTGAP